MYNYKIIDYPNGTLQVRYYSKPVITEREIEEFENCLITSFDDLKPDKHVLSDEDIKRIETIKEREKEIEERDKMLAKMYWDKGNANRAKNKVYEYSRSFIVSMRIISSSDKTCLSGFKSSNEVIKQFTNSSIS